MGEIPIEAKGSRTQRIEETKGKQGKIGYATS